MIILKPSKWVERCAIRLVEVTGMSPEKALDYATDCYSDDDPLDGITPELAADNAIDSWNSK